MKKRILSVLLIVVMLACLTTALIIGLNAAANIDSGTTGNLTWVLSDDGTLTISGTGNMPDYTSTTMPWYDYIDAIKTVVIKEGITSVGKYAFYKCAHLTSISLPSTIETVENPGPSGGIGAYAFSYSGLTSITIPQGVKAINPGILSNCAQLKTIYLLGYIPWDTSNDNAFSNSLQISQIYYPQATDATFEHLNFPNCIVYVGGMYPITSFGSMVANCNGGELVEDLPEDLNSFAMLKKDGFIFEGWYDNKNFTGTKYNSPQELKTAGKSACYANWIPNIGNGYVAVTYVDSLNNLSATWSLTEKGMIGDNIAKLKWDHEGVELIGWQINGEGKIYTNNTKLGDILPLNSSEIKLSAVWKPIMYFESDKLEYDTAQECYIANYPYDSRGYVIKPIDEFNIKASNGTSGHNSGIRTWQLLPDGEIVTQQTYEVCTPLDSGRYRFSVKIGKNNLFADILVNITKNKLENITVKKEISYEDAVKLQPGDIVNIESRDIKNWQGASLGDIISNQLLVCKVKEIPENIDDGIKVILYVNDEAIETMQESQYYDYHKEYEGELTVVRKLMLQPKSDIKVNYGFVLDDMNTPEAFGEYFDLDAFWNSIPDAVKTNIELALAEYGLSKEAIPSLLVDYGFYMDIPDVDNTEILPENSEHTVSIYSSWGASYELLELLTSLGLPSNYTFSSNTGSLKVKDRVFIDFKSGGDFNTICDADNDYYVGIEKYLISVPDSIFDEINLSVSDNIIFKDSTGAPISLTGNMTIEYCHKSDDNLYMTGPLTWANTYGAKHIARVTYEGDDIYSSFEAYVLVSIKSKLTVAASQNSIFLGDTFDIDNVELVLEGDVIKFSELSELKEELYSALPYLVSAGVIEVYLDDNVALTAAGNYTINVYFNQDALKYLPDDYQEAASLFEILTRNGQLNVIDMSEVTSDIEKLKQEIKDKTAAVEEALANSAEELAKGLEELTALKESLENYATKEDLEELKLELSKAGEAIDQAVTALSIKIDSLKKDLDEANGKIDTNSTNVDALRDEIDSLRQSTQEAIDTVKALHKADIDEINSQLNALQDSITEANKKISDAENRIAALEGKVEDLEDELENAVADLQTQIDSKASTADLADAIARLKEAITAVMDRADSQDEAFKTLLEAADAKLNEAIGELMNQVKALETNLNTANGKIDTNTSDVAILKTDVAALKSWQIEAQAAIGSLKSLSATKEDLKSAVERLEAALKTANDNISEAVKRIEALEGKVEDLEKNAEALKKAIAELEAVMTSSNEALAKEIKDLNAALEAAKKAASDADTELKKAIETAEAALKGAIDELNNRVTVIESILTSANANINTNTTDIATLKANIKTIEMLQSAAEQTIAEIGALVGTNEANIAELQASITKLQESIYAADGKIAAAEARIAVLEGKVEELEGVKNELQASVANLQAALATKADRATVNSAISALQASIAVLQMSQNNYIFADMTLKNELTAAIDAAKELAISAAKELVSRSATELQVAIDKKADSATLEAKAGELAEAIALAETTSKTYADAQDAVLKEAVDAELRAANELIATLGIRMTDAEAAIDALEAAVQALEKATADDAQALKDAVAALNQALAEAKALADAADAALDSALNQKITDAQTALDAKITDLQSKLNKAIKELKAADTSNANDLKKAIDAVETAMSAADAVRDAADKALETKIAEAKSELANKIAEVEANLSSAKDELNKALAAGDADLGEKVKALNEALEAAKAAYAASDADLKAELTEKIDEADAAIYALIEQIQKELKEANSELNVAVTQADEELKEKVTISTVVASVGVGGNVALLAWIIISKKRKLF